MKGNIVVYGFVVMLDVASYRPKPELGTYVGYERSKGSTYHLANAYNVAYGEGIDLHQVWES